MILTYEKGIMSYEDIVTDVVRQFGEVWRKVAEHLAEELYDEEFGFNKLVLESDFAPDIIVKQTGIRCPFLYAVIASSHSTSYMKYQVDKRDSYADPYNNMTINAMDTDISTFLTLAK